VPHKAQVALLLLLLLATCQYSVLLTQQLLLLLLPLGPAMNPCQSQQNPEPLDHCHRNPGHVKT
jgi:hypothetical protein